MLKDNSVNYTDLSEIETAQYNSLKLQNLDIQFSAYKHSKKLQLISRKNVIQNILLTNNINRNQLMG